jgi:hypothetical protein
MVKLQQELEATKLELQTVTSHTENNAATTSATLKEKDDEITRLREVAQSLEESEVSLVRSA